MKLNKKNFGAIIFIALILLLFFSRTIYTYNMPLVTGTRPIRGHLSNMEISRGFARYRETELILARLPGTVSKVFVREGDKVEEGDILLEMDFDIASAQRRYTELSNSKERLEADIRSSRTRLNNIISSLAENEIDGQERSAHGGLISLEINRLRQSYENTYFAYEQGSVSRNELINAENNLNALLYRYRAEADELEYSLLLKEIDLMNLMLSLEAASELLDNYYEHALVRSPVSGTITGLNAERGRFYQENSILLSIGIGNEFIIDCNISLDNNFVFPLDHAELRNTNYVIRGEVWRVRPVENAKIISISIYSEEVSEGESFEIIFEKTSNASFTLVPSAAVRLDNDGHFLYRIMRRRGIMGEEYYVERINIVIGESDHQYTSVIRGISFFDPVVLASDKALSQGETVILRNSDEFFEN